MDTEIKQATTFPHLRGYFKKTDGNDVFELGGTADVFKEGKEYQLLVLERGDGYMKRLAECALSIEALVFQGPLSKNRPNYNSPLTQDGLNIEIVHLLNSLGRFTGMLVNSSSWRDQELHDYDKMELRSRLEKLMQHLK